VPEISKIVPGRSASYPSAPPTDPYVRVSLIRFLGIQSLGTTLAHNFAAPQAELDIMDYSGFWHRKLIKNRDLELIPVDVPFVASPTQPVFPVSFRIVVYVVNCPIVTTYPIILVVPSYFKAQHLILFLQWHVSVSSKP